MVLLLVTPIYGVSIHFSIGSAGSGDITSVSAGSGLDGGGITGAITIDILPSADGGLSFDGDSLQIKFKDSTLLVDSYGVYVDTTLIASRWYAASNKRTEAEINDFTGALFESALGNSRYTYNVDTDILTQQVLLDYDGGLGLAGDDSVGIIADGVDVNMIDWSTIDTDDITQGSTNLFESTTISGNDGLNLSGQQLSLDTSPDNVGGFATLVEEEDALQIKYLSSQFSETADGLIIDNDGHSHTASTISGLGSADFTDFDGIVAATTAVGLNTAKVTNANHSGDVTGSGDLTIADNSVDGTDISLTSEVAGDIMYFNGTDWVRLGKGSAGQVLEMNVGETAPEWDTDDSGGAPTFDIMDGGSVISGAPTALDFFGTDFVLTDAITADSVNISIATGALNDEYEIVDAAITKSDEAETITANWVNTTHPWSDNEVSDTLTVLGGLSFSDTTAIIATQYYVDSNDTDTYLSEEQVEDYVGGMVTSNTETRISVTYEDSDGTFDFVVDDMNDDVPDIGDFGNAYDLDANGTVEKIMGIDISKIAPTDNYILKYDSGTDSLLWEIDSGGAGEISWSDTTSIIATQYYVGVNDDDIPEVGDFDAFVGGTNCTYDTDANQLNVDDAFLINSTDDTMAGVLTSNGLTITTTNALTLGSHRIDNGADSVNVRELGGGPVYFDISLIDEPWPGAYGDASVVPRYLQADAPINLSSWGDSALHIWFGETFYGGDFESIDDTLYINYAGRVTDSLESRISLGNLQGTLNLATQVVDTLSAHLIDLDDVQDQDLGGISIISGIWVVDQYTITENHFADARDWGDIRIKDNIAIIDTNGVSEYALKAVNAPADEDIFTYETTTGDFEWQTLSELGIQPLESTLTDIADGTITENLVNTAYPWANDEVADDITAGTATVATTVTITDNENTAEDNPVVFVSDGDQDGGNLGLESDGTFYYTPSTGTVTAGTFNGSLVNDSVDESEIDWGFSAGQVCIIDLPVASQVIDWNDAASFEIPNVANPTTDAEGEIAWDSNDDAIEVYSGDEAESALIPIYHTIDKTIMFPDGVNDEVYIFHVDSILYPFGIEIDQVSITLPADAVYSMVFEEWAGDPPVAQADIETVTTGSGDAYMEDSSITNNFVDADDYIFLHVPSTDVDWVGVQIIFHILGGN